MRVFICLALFFMASSASAELWIYSDQKIMGSKTKTELPSIKERGFYSYISKELPSMTVGKDASVVTVFESLRPASDWIVRVDTELDDYLVSWKSKGSQWYEIVESIDKQTPVNAFINHDQKVLAVSLFENSLPYLSMRRPSVWRLDESQTLKGNLARWAEVYGYSLVWRSANDYPIAASSSFYGDLLGDEGVLSRVVQSVNLSVERKFRIGFHVDHESEAISVYEIAHTNNKGFRQ